MPAPAYAARFCNFMHDLIIPLPQKVLKPTSVELQSFTPRPLPLDPLPEVSDNPQLLVYTESPLLPPPSHIPQVQAVPSEPPLILSAHLKSSNNATIDAPLTKSPSLVRSPRPLPLPKADGTVTSPTSIPFPSEYYTQHQRHRNSEQLRLELQKVLQSQIQEYRLLRQQRLQQEQERSPEPASLSSEILSPKQGRSKRMAGIFDTEVTFKL